MKCQDLFSSENKTKSKLSSALVVIDALRVNTHLGYTVFTLNIRTDSPEQTVQT